MSSHTRVPAPRSTVQRSVDSYLFMSDFHLGSDLVQHARPWAEKSWLREAPEGDASLVSLIESVQGEHGTKCIVFVGDFLDLVGVSLPLRAERISTPPTSEERRHGLGSPADHVVLKVQAIAERHRAVFDALGGFVRAGNRVVVVRGNHDVELHWQAAQRAFREEITGGQQELAERVEVCPWFYAVPGLFHAEHGHDYDVMCSYGDPLLPTSPGDSRRIRAVPFSSMLRYVARPTRGLSTASYENVSMGEYARMLMRFGAYGTACIALRFARAVWGLVDEWYGQLRRGLPQRALRLRAARARYASRSAFDAETLEAMRTLHTTPATHSLRRVLHLLYLDRVLMLLMAFASMAASALCARADATFSAGVALLAALVLSYHAVQTQSRDICARRPMRRGAEAIARLTGARYVLMGHTHTPEHVQITDDGAHYVNLGHWGEDDIPEERAQSRVGAPRTYFRLNVAAQGAHGELLQWDERLGARPYQPESSNDDALESAPKTVPQRV